MIADARLSTIRGLADSWSRRLAGIRIPQTEHLAALGTRVHAIVVADGRGTVEADQLAGELRTALHRFAESATAFRAAADHLRSLIDETLGSPRGK